MARILLVDDEPFLLEMLASAVEAKGHTVDTASNGAKGLKRFTERSFDLVITDIIMPDMEGLGMIQALRRQDPHAKIIAMSGGGAFGSLDVLGFAREFGAMAALTKPVGLQEFWNVVNGCLGEKASAGH